MASHRLGSCGSISAIVLALALLVGCGGATDPSGRDEAADAEVPSLPTEGSSSSILTWQTLDGPLGRCGPQPPGVSAAPLVIENIVEPGVGTLPAVRVGAGPTVAVLLHQTDGGGLCGWLPFASLIAREPGLSALAIDLCRYGESDCRKVAEGTFTDDDQNDAVQVAVDFARRRMGAERIVVVGASMGGSLALMSAAGLTGLDSAVSLSGPVDWPGMDAVRHGKRIRVPVLVAMAGSEGEFQVDGARQIVGNAPAGSQFLTSEGGHGYGLITDTDGNPAGLAAEVLAWLTRS